MRTRLQRAISELRALHGPGDAVLLILALMISGVLLARFPEDRLVVVVGMVLFASALAVWWIPRHRFSPMKIQLEPKDLATAENEARAGLAQLLAGLAVLAGLFFSWQQIQDTRRDSLEMQELTEQGQITDRFTRAVGQIGDQERQVRLGGIYALERIARDSKEDAGPVVEILTALVRERAPWPDPDAGTAQALERAAPVTRPPTPPADVQAVLTVLSRGNWRDWWPGEQLGAPSPGGLLCLNLSGADLRGVRLRGEALPPLCMAASNLVMANLTDADLGDAYLADADLSGAFLEGANLSDAYLACANLTGAYLREASLAGAYLGGATLVDANVMDTDLSGANLEGANLIGALNLSPEQLASIKIDAETELPSELRSAVSPDQSTLPDASSPARNCEQPATPVDNE